MVASKPASGDREVGGLSRYARPVASRILLLCAVALAAISCTETFAPNATSTEPSTTTLALASTTPGTPTTPSDRIDSGRLVIIESDGTVAIIEPDGSDRVALTASADESFYMQPVWSPDSTKIAFGEASAGAFAVRVEDVEGGDAVSMPVSSNPFFMYWAPDSERIGILRNGTEGLEFEIADVQARTLESVDSGSPFYFSWSPQGDRVVIHEGANRFEILDLSGGSTSLGDTAAGYLAPQWVPGGILHISGRMLVLTGENRTLELAEVGEQTMFVANSDASLVAFQTLAPREQTVALTQSDQLETNMLTVVDTRSLDVETVDDDPAVGMWWSPDGRSLLVLSLSGDGSSVSARVWSARGGLVDYATYRPSSTQVRDVFPFYPQYAQAMTFWAPDSSGFALAGEIDGLSGVWTQTLGDPEPDLVSDGHWVAWSPVG